MTGHASDARLHALWDALADFPPNAHDASLEHLLRELCVLMDCSNAAWSAALRLQASRNEDPLQGWRMREVRYLHPTPNLLNASRTYSANFDRHRPDVSTVRFYAQAGTFRVLRMVDLATPEWFEGEYYRWFFREGLGCVDGIRIGAPVSDDIEAGFALMRDDSRPRFTPEDCAMAAEIVRGLRWFHREQLSRRGLLNAEVPLTPTERRVLDLLLAGKTIKEIAAEQQHSTNTSNEYVGRIYRRFGVRSRAELMALWLSRR